MSSDDARAVATARLDDYINFCYRSLKNIDKGLELESLLDASESVSPLLDFLFAVDRRVRPFNKDLSWELDREPLEQLVGDLFLPRLRTIVATGDPAEQRSMFRDVEQLARSHRLGEVIDSWEPDVDWLRGVDSRPS